MLYMRDGQGRIHSFYLGPLQLNVQLQEGCTCRGEEEREQPSQPAKTAESILTINGVTDVMARLFSYPSLGDEREGKRR